MKLTSRIISRAGLLLGAAALAVLVQAETTTNEEPIQVIDDQKKGFASPGLSASTTIDAEGNIIPLSTTIQTPNRSELDEWLEEEDNLSSYVGEDAVIETLSTIAKAVNRISPTPDEIFTMCSPAGVLASLGLICPIVTISARVMIRNPPDFANLANEHHCPNPGYLLPISLEDLSQRFDGTPVPYFIPDDVIKREHATYGWYIRHIMNMYHFVFKWVDFNFGPQTDEDRDGLRPIIPVGWENQKVYFMRDPRNYVWPMGQSLTKNDLMVTFFRGTMLPGGWVADYTYEYANLTKTERHFPGRVHKGFYDYAVQFFPKFEQQFELHPHIKRIVFTGHSLGGAISVLSAAFMVRKYPHLKISTVTFGAPNAGDVEFTDWADRYINSRRIMYMGSGQSDFAEENGLKYGIGDMIPQMPVACKGYNLTACKLPFMKNPEGRKNFQYKQAGGNVRFFARDMPNTKRWIEQENYVLGPATFQKVNLTTGLMACHVCSYTCWTSQVTGDEDSRCYFPQDDPSGTNPYLCNINFHDSMTERYPELKGDSPMGPDGFGGLLDETVDYAVGTGGANNRRSLRENKQRKRRGGAA